MFNFFQKKTQGQEISLKIKGMHCASCAMNIDGALEDAVGVLSSETSYAQSKVRVCFDSKKITPEKIAQIIAQEGYEVTE